MAHRKLKKYSPWQTTIERKLENKEYIQQGIEQGIEQGIKAVRDLFQKGLLTEEQAKQAEEAIKAKCKTC